MTERRGDNFIYETADLPQIEVRLEDETIWLTHGQIVDVFASSKANVSEHIKHIYSSGELSREGTVRKFRTVAKEGDRMINSA